MKTYLVGLSILALAGHKFFSGLVQGMANLEIAITKVLGG